MCTVTYVPLGNNNFILTQNRDEGFDRPKSLLPEIYRNKDHRLIYPKDPVGKGTWMAVSDNRISACLLNGAFEKHKRNLPYQKSRGLVLLDVFEFDHISEFVKNYSFDNIEPFTIISVDNNHKGYEVVWDEKKIHCIPFDVNKPNIWSSSTLYTNDQKKERHQWYYNKIESSNEFNWKEITDFHLNGGIPYTENSIIMKRPKVGTVSITSIKVSDNLISMQYLDLYAKQKSEISMSASITEQLQ